MSNSAVVCKTKPQQDKTPCCIGKSCVAGAREDQKPKVGTGPGEARAEGRLSERRRPSQSAAPYPLRPSVRR